MKDIEESKSLEEQEEFKDVTIQRNSYSEKGQEKIDHNSKKDKKSKPTKTETHTILSTEIKNNLLGLIKTNMPKLENALQTMLETGQYKDYAQVMAQLMKYGAPSLQSVEVEVEEGTQDSLTKKLANLIKGKATTEDME